MHACRKHPTLDSIVFRFPQIKIYIYTQYASSGSTTYLHLEWESRGSWVRPRGGLRETEPISPAVLLELREGQVLSGRSNTGHGLMSKKEPSQKERLEDWRGPFQSLITWVTPTLVAPFLHMAHTHTHRRETCSQPTRTFSIFVWVNCDDPEQKPMHLETRNFRCLTPLPTGVPPGPSRGRAPGGGVIAMATGVPIGMGLIAIPLCRISAGEENIRHNARI